MFVGLCVFTLKSGSMGSCIYRGETTGSTVVFVSSKPP